MGLFVAVPIVFSFVLSLFSYSVIAPAHWVGLANYNTLLHDGNAQHAFYVTILLAVGIVIAEVAAGLALAVAVQRRMHWARSIYRSAFFVPLLVSGASISIVMSYVFDPQFGVLNYYLQQLGLPQIPWLNSPWGAIATIMIVVTWQQLGFTFIVFSAALGAVPRELIEAARTDGAGGWRIFRKITVPLISPSILFTVTVGIIGSLQLFDQPYVLTHGGPQNATNLFATYAFDLAMGAGQLGLGASVALTMLPALALLILALTLYMRRQ